MPYELAKQLKVGYGTHRIKTCSDCDLLSLLANKSFRCKPCQRSARLKKRNGWNSKYYLANKEKINKLGVAYQNKKRKTDPLFREMELTKGHKRRSILAGCEGTHTTAEWLNLLETVGFKCVKCNKKGLVLSRDHIRPISKGGTNYITNIQPLCISCNSSKKDKYESRN